MANKRDYYEVLGVSRDASDDDIKRAYRRKAKECHPDLHPDDKDAQARFQELNEANEVLSDPDKRARYDQFGFDGPNMGGMGGNPFGGMEFGDMGDIFSQIFGGGMGGAARRNAPRQGADVRYDLNLTFEEAALGCHKTIEFFRSENCATCHGTGAKPGTQPVTCPTCKGAGQIRQSGGWISTVTTCPACGGRGKVIKDKCPGCGSSGRTRARRTFEFNVPAGVDNNNVFYRRGEGEPGVNGGPNGDLAICIHVKAHKVFRRDGLNLRLDVTVPFTRAALGGEITIPTLEGDMKYTLPEGTQPGAEFRIRGKGIAQVQGSGKGDLIFRVRVEIPRKLTERQRELLREFDEGTAGRDADRQKSIFDKLRGL